MVSSLGEMIEFLTRFGIFDVVLPFLLIFSLSLWLFISRFGKKEFNYKRGVLVMIGFVIVEGILTILSSIIPFINIIAIFLSIGLLIWIILMYIKRKYLDIVHVYFFWICSVIVALLVVSISKLMIALNISIGIIIVIVFVLALLIFGIYLTKRKMK